MPLKHSTETVLVTVLALIIVAAGIVTAALPPLTVSPWPWVLAFVLSMLYPLVVYPLLKSRRADYPFRALHFYPALLLLIWMGLELARSVWSSALPAQQVYIWGWTAGGVIIGLVLLLMFCAHVIRQRFKRSFALGLIGALFVGVAVIGEEYRAPERMSLRIASLVHSGEELIGRNLDSSSDGAEESWRMKLRSLARREERLQARSDEEANSSIQATLSGAMAHSQAMIAARATSSQGTMTDDGMVAARRRDVDAPPRLTQTGGEIGWIAVLLLAGYSGLLHSRAKRRLEA